MTMETKPAPAKIDLDGPAGLLKIAWKDGHLSELSLNRVRKACPCATCNEERAKPVDPFRIFTPAELGNARVQSAELVGHYAMKIRWQDGHDTGIYAWETLRALCDCDKCTGKNGG